MWFGHWQSLVAQMVKNPLAMQETWVQSLGWEDPLEKGMATHSSILAWRTPWTEEPGKLQSMPGYSPRGHKELDTTEQLSLMPTAISNWGWVRSASYAYFSLGHFISSVATACQISLSITNSRSLPNSCPLSRWCHLTISSSVVPFSSCLQSFPASGSFQMSQLFASGGWNIGVSTSTSILPMNTQDWFPLGWTGWISLQSKALSRVFSNTTVQKHQFIGTQLSLYSNSHIHTWTLEKP